MRVFSDDDDRSDSLVREMSTSDDSVAKPKYDVPKGTKHTSFIAMTQSATVCNRTSPNLKRKQILDLLLWTANVHVTSVVATWVAESPGVGGFWVESDS